MTQIQANLGFFFPGQGSHSIGMLAAAADEFSSINQTFSQASEILGYDLWDLCQNGEKSAIDMTEVTQPLLLTASVSLWRVWCEQTDIRPAAMAGHSLGEWSALVCAGVVDFVTALKLVRLRGKYMQEAVPAGVGSMAAIIGLDDEQIRSVCTKCSDDELVVPVNYNSPGQVVIAGHKAAVDAAIEGCKAAGAKKAMPLAVSAPFHMPLMQPAADRLAAEIETIEFAQPAQPIVHNVTADTCVDPEQIKRLMIEQIYKPVLWVDCVQKLQALGVEVGVECGPGKVLTGLVKRIDRQFKVQPIESPDGLAAALGNS
jgi:[acyl-carrier-protein] S-malonyltransferase